MERQNILCRQESIHKGSHKESKEQGLLQELNIVQNEWPMEGHMDKSQSQQEIWMAKK